jgi:hypothetical protein
MFSGEEYFEKCKKEAENLKRIRKKEFEILSKEIIIPKLVFNEQEIKRWRNKRGAIYADEVSVIADENLRDKLQNYLKGTRHAFMSNGDRIKFDK